MNAEAIATVVYGRRFTRADIEIQRAILELVHYVLCNPSIPVESYHRNYCFITGQPESYRNFAMLPAKAQQQDRDDLAAIVNLLPEWNGEK